MKIYRILQFFLLFWVKSDVFGKSEVCVSKFNVKNPLNSDGYRLETYLTLPGEVYLEQVWRRESIWRKEKTGGVSKECMNFLNIFSNATSKFLICAMTNARPLQYCEHCVGEYTDVNNAFNDIANKDINGTTCEDQILRADNVQVVLLAYTFVQDVWEKSTCPNCYCTATVNGTTVYHARNETVTMLKKIQETLECFHDFPADGSGTGNNSVCFICREFYIKSNNFYDDLEEQGQLCSDLKDSMNYTRRMWSTVFSCTVVIKDDLTIYSISIAVLLLPVIFYIGLWAFVERNERRRKSGSFRSPSAPVNSTEVEEDESQDQDEPRDEDEPHY